MQKFLKNAFLFSLPVIIICTVIEIALRNTPNDYTQKKSLLDEKIPDVEVLVLGSSNSLFGVNPAFIKMKCFNASQVSQSINFDYEILKKYDTSFHHLKALVIPVSYVTFYLRLEDNAESWRVKDYNLYYGITKYSNLEDYSEVLSNTLRNSLKILDKRYTKGVTFTGDSLGWGHNIAEVLPDTDLEKTAKEGAKRHNDICNNGKYYNENLKIIKEIIDFATRKKAKVLFFTPPVYDLYWLDIDTVKFAKEINNLKKISAENNNVVYCNFLKDSAFNAVDFHDADHLNKFGAMKLTQKIDSVLDKIVN